MFLKLEMAHGRFVLKDVSSDMGISMWNNFVEGAITFAFYFLICALKSGQIQN